MKLSSSKSNVFTFVLLACRAVVDQFGCIFFFWKRATHAGKAARVFETYQAVGSGWQWRCWYGCARSASGRLRTWCELRFVDCDPNLARQVFANLLSNAVKFTLPRNPAVIEVGQSQHQGQTVLFVRDNCVGFSMKYADKLFRPFQRLHRQEDFEGAGIGLATVLRLVLKHGGRIWPEAAPDTGATFYFTLGPTVEPQSGREREETTVIGADS
jgi:signal transduction histidine kinase